MTKIELRNSAGLRRILLAVVLLMACGLSLSTATTAASSATGLGQGYCDEPELPMEKNPPFVKVRLGISRKTVAPGKVLRIRVENLGASTVAYGYVYRMARRKDGSWINQPTGPFFAPRIYAQPGRAGFCQEVPIDKDAQPGIYRITKEVTPVESEQEGPITVRVTFRVR